MVYVVAHHGLGLVEESGSFFGVAAAVKHFLEELGVVSTRGLNEKLTWFRALISLVEAVGGALQIRAGEGRDNIHRCPPEEIEGLPFRLSHAFILFTVWRQLRSWVASCAARRVLTSREFALQNGGKIFKAVKERGLQVTQREGLQRRVSL